MATDREYLEMMAQNIDRRMTDGFTAVTKTVERIEGVQKTTCDRVIELEKSDSATTARTGMITGILSILGFIGLFIKDLFFKG